MPLTAIFPSSFANFIPLELFTVAGLDDAAVVTFGLDEDGIEGVEDVDCVAVSEMDEEDSTCFEGEATTFEDVSEDTLLGVQALTNSSKAVSKLEKYIFRVFIFNPFIIFLLRTMENL